MMTRTQRSLKVERFCLEAIKPGQSLSGAYRIAFKPKHCSAKSIHELASRLRKTVKVESRLKELMAPMVTAVQGEKALWMEKVRRSAMFDVGKMFDTHGNPIEIPALPDEVRPAVAGYEFTEEYTGKGESRTAVGYTRKFKLVDPLRALELYGKATGFYRPDEMQATPLSNLSVQVVFVEGRRRPTPEPPEVKFVGR